MNEIEEAIKEINHTKQFYSSDKNFNLAVKALKKQMPKKPNYDDNFKITYCDCGARTLPGQRYCSQCGQKLEVQIDWSVEE